MQGYRQTGMRHEAGWPCGSSRCQAAAACREASGFAAERRLERADAAIEPKLCQMVLLLCVDALRVCCGYPAFGRDGGCRHRLAEDVSVPGACSQRHHAAGIGLGCLPGVAGVAADACSGPMHARGESGFSSRRRQPSAAIGRPGAREAHLRGVPGRTGTWRPAVAGDRLLRPRGNGKTALLARLHREAAKHADEVDVIHLTPSTIATEERLIGRLAARWWQRLVPGELSIRGVRGQPGRGARPRWTRCWLLVRRKSRCCCCWTRPTLWMRKSAMRC